MAGVEQSGTSALGDLHLKRLGFGAMQLSGPNVSGPPKDRAAALAVLREAVASGVNHIDTSDYYGPHVTNQLIHDALYPYPDDLVIVTKVGARRGRDGSVLEASSPNELITPHILLIAGTSSVAHLRENLTFANLRLPDNALGTLDELTRRRA